MKYTYFIGVDMGKDNFHYCIQQNHKNLASLEVSNNSEGLEKLKKDIEALETNDANRVLLCVEQTGIYTQPLLEWSHEQGYDLWLENPLAIKKSLGIHRGKTDSIDAQRIAEYAARYVDRVRLWQPSKKVIPTSKAYYAFVKDCSQTSNSSRPL